MGVSPQLRLGKEGTCMKAEPERAGKIEAEQWACSGSAQPALTARFLGSHACGLTFIPPCSPGLVHGRPGSPWSSKPSLTLNDDVGH